MRTRWIGVDTDGLNDGDLLTYDKASHRVSKGTVPLSLPMEITQDWEVTASNRSINRLAARSDLNDIEVTLPDDNAAYGLRMVINHPAGSNTVMVTAGDAMFVDSGTGAEVAMLEVPLRETLEALGEFLTDSGTMPAPPGFLKDGVPYTGTGRIVYSLT